MALEPPVQLAARGWVVWGESWGHHVATVALGGLQETGQYRHARRPACGRCTKHSRRSQLETGGQRRLAGSACRRSAGRPPSSSTCSAEALRRSASNVTFACFYHPRPRRTPPAPTRDSRGMTAYPAMSQGSAHTQLPPLDGHGSEHRPHLGHHFPARAEFLDWEAISTFEYRKVRVEHSETTSYPILRCAQRIRNVIFH